MNFPGWQKTSLSLGFTFLACASTNIVTAEPDKQSTAPRNAVPALSSSPKSNLMNAADHRAIKNDSAKIREDIKDPDSMPPIKGFHPIKKLWRPIDKMNNTVGKLQKQVTRLQKPINVLTPPMLELQENMTNVDKRIGSMESQLTDLHNGVTGVRSDLKSTSKSISSLRVPLVALKQPMENIAGPISALDAQLNWIIAAIVIAAGGVAVGAPIAALLIYINRFRLFPAFFTKNYSGHSA